MGTLHRLAISCAIVVITLCVLWSFLDKRLEISGITQTLFSELKGNFEVDNTVLVNGSTVNNGVNGSTVNDGILGNTEEPHRECLNITVIYYTLWYGRRAPYFKIEIKSQPQYKRVPLEDALDTYSTSCYTDDLCFNITFTVWEDTQCNASDSNTICAYINHLHDEPKKKRTHPDEILIYEMFETDKNWAPKGIEQCNLLMGYQDNADIFADAYRSLPIVYERDYISFLLSPPRSTFQEKVSDYVVAWASSNCGPVFRITIMEELMKYVDILSFGKCLKNTNINIKHTDPDLQSLELISKHKFYVVIVNSICRDYLSEKLTRAILAGVVPILYMPRHNGTRWPNYIDALPTDEDHPFVNQSAINLADFKTVREAGKYINKVASDEELYNSFLWYKFLEDDEAAALRKRLEVSLRHDIMFDLRIPARQSSLCRLGETIANTNPHEFLKPMNHCTEINLSDEYLHK